ncbi:M23 family metallopeptidase [Dyella sp. 2HG41-7]|uniref:M23 family metallopeptidase n=1 Tax=Dyella sp. 2HG41-7 TaxID=2883239 RepID=UPI001F17AF9C
MKKSPVDAVTSITSRAKASMMVALLASLACQMTSASDAATHPAPPHASPFPPQIQLNVPFAPTAFPGEDGEHLLYELQVTNFENTPITLDHVDILNAIHTDTAPLASFAGHLLNNIVRLAGADDVTDTGNVAKPININAGATAVLFLSVTAPSKAAMPERVVQRVAFTNGEVVEGAAVGTHSSTLKVLGAPVVGTDWIGDDGPSNAADNHHRRGIFVVDGNMTISRRFAIDWKQMEQGLPYHGDIHADRSYYAYDKPVLAVATATVVYVRDGLPDNPPGHFPNFHPARPVTFDNAGGNTIVLDLGDGQFAHYYHLKAGTIQVKKGQRVNIGDVIAHVGASGDAREPHLHFEVTTAIPLLVGEGIPYVIDHFKVIGGEGHSPGVRRNETPLDGMLVDFENGGRD